MRTRERTEYCCTFRRKLKFDSRLKTIDELVSLLLYALIGATHQEETHEFIR